MEKRTQHVNLFRAGQPMQIMCSIHSEDRPGKWGKKTCEWTPGRVKWKTDTDEMDQQWNSGGHVCVSLIDDQKFARS